MRFTIVLFLFFISTLYAEENLDALLSTYKKQSDLSYITKQESAGFLDIYTRDDLEKMQSHNLLDVLKSISDIYITKGANNLPLFTPATLSKLPLTAARLYINDHDMTSSSFGSAFLMWGEMPIEYIDHIEVYKGSSSIEFGNEPGLLVIRIYTKNAERDNGSKARLMADQKASYDLNFYTADITHNDIAYFLYANIDEYNNDKYHHLYNNTDYTIKSDKEGYNFYGSLDYHDTRIEVGNYHKRNDSFLGAGSKKTPQGGELNGNHFYAHLTQQLPMDISLQLAYDKFDYKRTYIDPNGIRIFDDINNSGYISVNDYLIEFEDEIHSVILEKKLRFAGNSLLLGAFYKRKKMVQEGQYDTLHDPSISNALDLYSVYFEEQYDFDPNTRFVAMAKGDFYRYEKGVKSRDELIARLGLIKNIQNFQCKFFYTYSYLPNGFYQLYNPDNTPYLSTPTLDTAKAQIYTGNVRYSARRWSLQLLYVYHTLKDSLGYIPYQGYINTDEKQTFQDYELKGEYRFDQDNKLLASLFSGNNSKGQIQSPKYGLNVRLFNTYAMFDIYNELLYRSSFTAQVGQSVYVPYSLDWTLGIKYHHSKDFSIGLRGENILDRSQHIPFRGYDKIVQMFDRKVWINLEYTF